jgi:hypothetical protein
VIHRRFGGVLLFFLAVGKLKGIVAVRRLRFDLGHHTGARFDNSAGGLLACGVEDTGHSDFLPNDTFHKPCVYASRVSGQSGGINQTSIPVRHRPFPFWGSTDGKQTLNGLFYVNQSALFFSPKAN